MKTIIFVVLIGLGIQATYAQPRTQKHTIHSQYTAKTYELVVLLPENYSANDTTHYPVLYLLDGKYSLPLFQSIQNLMDLGKEIRGMIIVGIDGYNQTKDEWLASRHGDFTPSNQPQADTLWTKIMKLPEGALHSGGAEKFLQALQHEMIPLIEHEYKTSGERGLYGHSLGGLFASYCLLKAPSLFNRYSINSPSLWWNANELLKMEAPADSAINARVFFSVGAYEGEMMLQPFRAFTGAIIEHHYKNLETSVRVFEEETHLSVVSSCSSKTLKVLYPIGDQIR